MDLATTYTIKARVTGQESLNGLDKGLGKVKESSNRTATAFNKLKRAGNSLMGVLGSIGASAAVSSFLKAGVDMQRTGKTLKILTDEYGEHKQVLDFVSSAADRFGLGQHTATEGVADLFARLRPMGITLDEIKDTYLGLNNAALRYNLSAYDLAGVQLQLGQALGSGVLQGDEFRSIMERLPAIGQAVADVMGVQVGELKQLSSDGELTTEVIIKAMKKLKDMDVPPPDAFRLFRKEMENLSVIIGTRLLPAFTPVVRFVSGLLEKFTNLPAPLQTIIAGVTALAAGLVIIAPALGLIVTGLGALGTAISAVVGFFAPLLAGGAIPLAIIALGALIFKFRDQIGQAFAAIGRFIFAPFRPFAEFVGNIFVNAVRMAQNAFGRLPKIVQDVIKVATAPLRGFLTFLNKILSVLRRVKSGKESAESSGSASSFMPDLNLPNLPSSSSSIPDFVPPSFSSPTPSSSSGKTSSSSKNDYNIPGQDLSEGNIGKNKYTQNYGSRKSDNLKLTKLSEGHYKISNAMSKRQPPNINMNMNVTQFEGNNYVTTQDLQSAVQESVGQTMNYLEAEGVRYNLGM